MPNEGSGAGGLGGGGNYQRIPKRGRGRSLPPRSYTYSPPSSQPHTEHGANIRGPVESGGQQSYYRGGAVVQPRGHIGRGPSGRQVYHTQGAWKAIQKQQQARQAAKPSPGVDQRKLALLTLLGGFHFSPGSGPVPSPDRTTGRELAGFASSAFTGQGPLADAANGFYPDAAGAKRAGYGTQAGNPKQQAVAAKDLSYQDPLRQVGRKIAAEVGSVVAHSSIGAGVGNVIATQTWNKLAPLFQRKASEMPSTSFGKGSVGGGGGEVAGGKVSIGSDELSALFSVSPTARKLGVQGLKGILAHEYAHTQQGQGDRAVPFRSTPSMKGRFYSPKLEGGADAFRSAVGPILGYPSQQPNPRTDYGRAQARQFTRGGGYRDPSDIRKALLLQFPRVKQRLAQ